jgi:hypothetical protein
MSTKVKGDKIKEGSIPLSALSTEVKDKIENAGGGADWNALEGEAGYIENKPCSIDYMIISDNPVISDMSTSGFENSETYEISNQYLHYADIIGLYANEGNYNGVVYVPIKYGMINTLNHTIYQNGSSSRIYISIDATYGAMGARQIKVKSGSKITKIIGVAAFNKINENYLPDTVLKTTPQTLSNADKNQALANLGIDPVVWKYICNPNFLRSGYDIPNEFLEIVDDRIVLKYKIKGMYYGEVIDHFDDDRIYIIPKNNVRSIYHIEENTSPSTPGSLGTYYWKCIEEEEA